MSFKLKLLFSFVILIVAAHLQVNPAFARKFRLNIGSPYGYYNNLYPYDTSFYSVPVYRSYYGSVYGVAPVTLYPSTLYNDSCNQYYATPPLLYNQGAGSSFTLSF